MSSDLADAAVEYARRGYLVFPLAPRTKVPAIPGARAKRPGPGRGFLDGTTDVEVVERWWSGRDPWLRVRGPHCNIGCRVPPGVLVLDVDARSGGPDWLDEQQDAYSPIPPTLTCWSGSGSGSRHLWLQHPGGKVTHTRLVGCEIKTHATGYVALPPSIHSSGGTYQWDETGAPIAVPPAWLLELLRPIARETPTRRPPRPRPYTGDSIIDAYNARHCPGQLCVDWLGWRWAGDRDLLHPSASSARSATIDDTPSGRLLYVWSTNTPFDPTYPGDPHGYDAFDVYAILRHHGDKRAAARELQAEADRTIGLAG